MGNKVTTLVAKRAYFPDDFEKTLEDVLNEIYAHEVSSRERIVAVSGERSLVFASLERNPINDGVFLRIFEFEKGATGIINFDFSSTSADIEEHLPPKEREFLREQISMLVSGNEIYACSFGNRNRMIARAILDLAGKMTALTSGVGMRIEDLPANVTVEEIQRIGVRELHFLFTDYLESVSQRTSLGSRVLDALLLQMRGTSAIHKRKATVAKFKASRGAFGKEELHRDR